MRSALRWLLLLPFLLLSLLPPAVMPARAANGLPELVLCDGGPLVMVVDPLTGQPVPKTPDRHAGQCDWAGAHPAAALAALPDLPARQARILALPVPVAAMVMAMARATGLPPATGPPFPV